MTSTRLVLLFCVVWTVLNCGRTNDDASGADAGTSGTGGSTATGTGGAGGSPATGGVPSGGGSRDSGGAPAMGGMGGVRNTDYTAPTGGTTGIGGSSANVNIHECQVLYTVPAPKDVCFFCDPLPPGSSEGCGVPVSCTDTDTESAVRYPVGCRVIFPRRNEFYPDVFQEADCYSAWAPNWSCLL